MVAPTPRPAAANAPPAQTAGLAPRAGTSLAARRWRAFRSNHLAMVSLGVLIVIHLAALLAPWLTPYQPQRIAPAEAFQGPSARHWLGTDEVGRDVATRLLYGGQISLLVGVAAVAVSLAVGIAVGAVSGFFGGALDAILMRLTDAMMAVPTFFLLLLVLTIFGGATPTVILVIGLTSWMSVARLVRGEMLRFTDAEFVVAARTLGLPPWRIMLRHVLPQATGAIVVSATLGVAFAILTETALSYLGLGVQPPTPTWGNMLQKAQEAMFDSPLLALAPGVMILLTVLCYNIVGDALRDALDPRLGG